MEVVELGRLSTRGTFWRGKRVLLTGHTGFKGAWTALLLQTLGAQVTGVALAPPTQPNLYENLSPWPDLVSHICDIRDQPALERLVTAVDAEIVIHMAAQPLVLESYDNPLPTLNTNIIGTANLLDAVRRAGSTQAVLVITSDKVYENDGAGAAFDEKSALGGSDPYSASKACAEIVTAAYARSFLAKAGVRVVTARAGNIIGGGDWGQNRLVPDLWRAFANGGRADIRYPGAVRPWQHVFEPLNGYLAYVERAMSQQDLPRSLNFGPPPEPRLTVAELANRFASMLDAPDLWRTAGPPRVEATVLSIDAGLAERALGWKTRLSLDEALKMTADWYRACKAGDDMRRFSLRQLEQYFGNE